MTSYHIACGKCGWAEEITPELFSDTTAYISCPDCLNGLGLVSFSIETPLGTSGTPAEPSMFDDVREFVRKFGKTLEMLFWAPTSTVSLVYLIAWILLVIVWLIWPRHISIMVMSAFGAGYQLATLLKGK